MSKVLVSLSVSVDGYITGRDPTARRGLGERLDLVILRKARSLRSCKSSLR
jgi:hypothetical protein